MAIVTVSGTQTFGMSGARNGGTTTVINQGNIGYAQGIQFFQNTAVTRFAVFNQTVTTNPSNAQVGLQTIDATTGLPSGTFLTSAAANSYTANSWNIFTLSTPYNVTAGDKFYAVWFNNTGSTINITMNTSEFGVMFRNINPTYAANKTTTAGAWVKSTPFPIYVGNATQWFGESNSFSSNSFTPNTTDEFGFSFTLPNNIPEVRLKQIETILGAQNVNTLDVTYKIYNSSGTLLQNIDTYDLARTAASSASATQNILHTNATDLWLSGGQKYYVMMALAGTGTVTAITLQQGLDLTSSAQGILTKYTTKVGSTFTESATEYVSMRLICDAVRYDNSAGGGGGIVNASSMFTGGFSG